MSLADRLDSARRSSGAQLRPPSSEHGPAGGAPARRRPVRRGQGPRAPGPHRQPRPAALRPAPARGRAGGPGAPDPPGDDRRRADAALARGPHPHRAGGLRRDPRPRPARAAAPRPGDHRDHGQRRRTPIYVERAGKIYPVDAHFSNEAHLRRVIDKIVGRVGRRIDEASPLVDARLPDGSRVNAVISPVALDGAVLTIRKFSADPFTDADLIAFGTMSPAGARLPQGLRPRPPQHHHLRRHRLREDDDAQRHLLLPPGGRAHRHHRGRRRAPAAPGPRPAPRVASGQHRGPRARSPSATSSRTPSACGPTASSSARSATAPRSTCSRP